MKLLSALAVLALAQAVPPAQSATGTGLIIGQVVDGGAGKPIGGVSVSINAVGPLTEGFQYRTVLTDAEGHFVFAALPAGRFAMTASKQGYVSSGFGQRTPVQPISMSGARIDLADGERKGNVSIVMWKAASITGTVVDEANEPMVGVQVMSLRRGPVTAAMPPGQIQGTGTTDDRGVYRISQLSPGSYVVVFSTLHSTSPSSVQEFAVNARRTGISDNSRQLDANGANFPTTAGLPASSLLLTSGNGASLGSGPRLPSLPLTDERRVQVYETTYYPGTVTLSRATEVALKSGEERTGIDFQLQPVASLRVSGTVSGPDGPGGMLGLTLTRVDVEDQFAASAFDAATTVSDATGAFTFLGVTPGQYTLRVLKTPVRPTSAPSMSTVIQMGSTTISSSSGSLTRPPIPKEPTLSAMVPVVVGDRDVADLSVTLTAGARISGQLKFEGTAAMPDATRIQQMGVSIDPVVAHGGRIGNSFTILQGQFDAEGRLSTYQIPPGAYVLRLGTVNGWNVKSVTLKGEDITDIPFTAGTSDLTDVVITYTDTPAQISGTVVGNNGQTDPSAIVVAYPTDPSRWKSYTFTSMRMKITRLSSLGAYTLTGILPGEYFVAALPDDQLANWPDPAFLQTLSARASRVKIADGQKLTQDLKIVVTR